MTNEQRKFLIAANLLELQRRTLQKCVGAHVSSKIGSASVYGTGEKLLHATLQNELIIQNKAV